MYVPGGHTTPSKIFLIPINYTGILNFCKLLTFIFFEKSRKILLENNK
ncbi:hypothetical protein RU89_GL001654 [Lactococcus cremoris]|nr:hypothetical protein llh_3760 [Lactococcus cremoris subsp. cremoris A76]KZK10632.1 hypothetical protein AB995_1661 [Lactococcus cremoris]KZK38602.1 hypothetical protein LMG6897_1667 [Lactococcus cremoris]KZK45919.1 hypothetical protein SK110_1837 [Lactococcus cremoris]KZK46194.1 hypothetical protein B40_0702 [Lactococcus cremoris]